MKPETTRSQPSGGLRSEPLKDQIANILREKIVSGDYALGEQLSEKNIGAELGVSRTPIREAMLSLERNGLIIIRPQSGTYVFNPSRSDTIHLCKMREILETAAIKLAAESQDKMLFERLSDIISESERLLSQNLAEVHVLDNLFHFTLIEASGNPFLLDAYKTISDKLRALRQLLPLSSKRIAPALKQHKQILVAIKNNDVEKAEEILRSHVDNVERMLLENID